MRIRHGIAVVGLVAAALYPSKLEAAESLTRLPLAAADVPVHEEDWYAVSMLSARIAWTRYAIDRVASIDAPAKALIRVTQENHIRARYNGTTKIAVEAKILEFDASPPYSFVGGRISAQGDDGNQSLLLRASATGMKAVRTDASGTREASLGAVDFSLEDVLTLRSWCARGRKLGDTMTCRTFDTLNLVVSHRRVTVVGLGSEGASSASIRWVDVRT